MTLNTSIVSPELDLVSTVVVQHTLWESTTCIDCEAEGSFPFGRCPHCFDAKLFLWKAAQEALRSGKKTKGHLPGCGDGPDRDMTQDQFDKWRKAKAQNYQQDRVLSSVPR